MEKNDYITVSQLNRYIKYKIDNDPNLGVVFLKGEISNFKKHSRGHFYFTLKDENSRISAIMFQNNAIKVKFPPTDGMKVLVVGRITVYEASGSYQIIVENMEEDGFGNLYLAFERLKEKLNKEGLFKEEHKKRIPKIPKKIGIITAPTGAAIKDILSTIKRRWPIAETILFPSLVQGELAKNDIVKKIELANTYDIDVLIVGRGGGSIEDLWPFNEECVARAIYNSKVPIISAVGHEIDFTIADFVADKRAPTPTGAAEMAVPNLPDVLNYLEQVTIRLKKALLHKVSIYNEKLTSLENSQVFKNPKRIYEIKEQAFSNLYENLIKSMNLYILNKSTKLEELKKSFVFKNPKVLLIDDIYLYNDLIKKIKNLGKDYLKEKENNYLNLLNKVEVLNPITTIKRGYSITTKNEKAITKLEEVAKGDIIKTRINEGYLESEVKEIYGAKY